MEAKAREHESMIGQSSGKAALQHAISAAELYMKAADEATTAAERARLKRRCQELVVRAEQLKTAAPLPPPPTRPLQQSRELSTLEKTIVLRSSRLHGSVFPPWEAEPGLGTFAPASKGEPLYNDPCSFSFSEKQRGIFAGWKRPRELFVGQQLPELALAGAGDCDLVQDVTADCSVVASLCATWRHMDVLLATMMYPFDRETRRPVFSANGKYIFRMHFNGCFRQVVIDDRLPSSSTSRTLFVVDRRNPQLIWPALLEKAYLKVRGGYDFPGSNSGTDLWILTGWIPEQVFLRSDDIELDQSWNRIHKAYGYGDVVVTLGTGKLSREEEETLGLAGQHDYAMMDLRVENGVRQMLLKNPWCDGLVWRGVGSSSSPQQPPPIIEQVSSPGALTGAFWITFEDIVQNFESLYLNWNPSLFTHRQDHHFAWTLPSKAMALALAHNPQYSLRPTADGAVWILLSRHFQDDELSLARSRRPRPSADNPDPGSGSLGFMSLYVFDTDGTRVQVSDRPRSIHRGPFIDSPQTLLRFETSGDRTYTVAVAQVGLPLPTYAFTLSVFSRTPCRVARAADEMAHYHEMAGAWTRRTAGGNASTPTFVHNPQYALVLPHATPLSLLLCADADDVPVRVDLVWADGRRVASLAGRDVVASSGEYRRGGALAAVSRASPSAVTGAAVVDAGTYTVVLSTFEPGQRAAFTLRVGAMCSATLHPVAADAAGRLRMPMDPVVFDLPPFSAAATATVTTITTSPGPGPHQRRRRRAPHHVARLTRASLIARATGGSSAAACAFRIALELGIGSNRSVLVASDDGSSDGDSDGAEFRDASLGLRTPDVDLDPSELARRGGDLWVIVEQVGSQLPGQGVQVDVLSDNAVQVAGPWEAVDE